MKPSGIITLLTDFGNRDPYVAMMKGVILSINPRASLVDITHEIPPGVVLPGAMILRETYPYFPEGTIHVGVVDPGVGSDRRPICLEAAGHFFVGPDNGLFWLVLQGVRNGRVIHLTESRFFLPSVSSTFHGRDVFAPVAAHLSVGTRIEEFGIPISDPVPLPVPAPYRDGDTLCGQIIHEDRFGNLISNIDRKHLDEFLKESTPRIEAGSLVVGKLNRTYSEVGEGQPLALINSAGLLEIAVNRGRASDPVGVKQEDLIGTTVKVERGAATACRLLKNVQIQGRGARQWVPPGRVGCSSEAKKHPEE